MSTHLERPATALIVHAHPESDSFSSAQAETARSALEAQAYAVEVIDLYAKRWRPVLDRKEFPPVHGAFKPQREQRHAVKTGTLATDVRADLDALLRADLLVLSFPMWWFSVPAILKGWLDRVLVMGAVFGGELGLFEDAAMAGRRAVLLATTGGSPDAFRPDGEFGDIDSFLFHINRGVLEFVGYDAVAPVITYGPARLTESDRRTALAAVRDAFIDIDERPLAPTSRSRRAVAIGSSGTSH